MTNTSVSHYATPTIIYGTAWKEERTTALVEQALATGFTAIDTANQPKHYQEALVGAALKDRPRESLFLQTKFTPVDGQDHRVPYDPRATVDEQVNQSFASSLANLGTDYLDSYLLHGPYSHPDLGESDWQVWRALEELHKSGRVKAIGISNVNEQQLESLLEDAEIAPAVVQNRCYANRGWDRGVRKLCGKSGIAYQGFSLLTANPFVVQHPKVQKIAQHLSRTPEQVIYRFSIQIGMTPLTGTTNQQHMSEALAVLDFELSQESVQLIETLGV